MTRRSSRRCTGTEPLAADALSVGRTKLYQLMASGALRSVRIDKSRRVPHSALVDLVERLEQDQASEPEPEPARLAARSGLG